MHSNGDLDGRLNDDNWHDSLYARPQSSQVVKYPWKEKKKKKKASGQG